MPLVRRLPKRGFTNNFRIEFQVVNLRDLERVFGDGDVVSHQKAKLNEVNGSSTARKI
jgi:large subunit ribosomal protein L15